MILGHGGNSIMSQLGPDWEPGVITIDGVDYPTIKIGTRHWTTLNLRCNTTNSQWYKNSSTYSSGQYYKLGKYYDERDCEELQAKLNNGWRLPTGTDFLALCRSAGSTDEERVNNTFDLDDFGNTHGNGSIPLKLVSGGRAQGRGSSWDGLTYGNLLGERTGPSESIAVSGGCSSYDNSYGYFWPRTFLAANDYIYRYNIRLCKSIYDKVTIRGYNYDYARIGNRYWTLSDFRYNALPKGWRYFYHHPDISSGLLDSAAINSGWRLPSAADFNDLAAVPNFHDKMEFYVTGRYDYSDSSYDYSFRKTYYYSTDGAETTSTLFPGAIMDYDAKTCEMAQVHVDFGFCIRLCKDV